MSLIRNRLQCKQCKDIIESHSVHDFKRCKCGSIFVDGGKEYSKFGWPDGNWKDWIEDLSEYDDGNGS